MRSTTAGTVKTDADLDPAIEAHVHELLRCPYRRCVQGDPAEGYLGFVPELPGCLTAGATAAEALANLEEALSLWLYSVLERGQEVPDPAPLPSLAEALKRPSGKLLVRVPKSVHAAILARAQQEGVSANQLILTALAKELGRTETETVTGTGTGTHP